MIGGPSNAVVNPVIWLTTAIVVEVILRAFFPLLVDDNDTI